MRLPIEALSVSSMRTATECPEKWRRRYVLHEYEPPNGKMTRGSTVGAAEAQSDHEWIETGEPLSTADVLDAYADEWAALDEGEVDWQGEKPIEIRESGEATLRVYHEELLPTMPAPVDAERELRFEVAGEEGQIVPVVAYPDIETEDGRVRDRKVSGAQWSQEKVDTDWQAATYLAGRRAEGQPAAGFDFEIAKPNKAPKVYRLSTERSDEQLDHFLTVILGIAAELEWRMETDTWGYAPPGAWYCSAKSCGYWSSCAAGGLMRGRAAKAVAAS